MDLGGAVVWLRGALTARDIARLDEAMPYGAASGRLADPSAFDALDGLAAVRERFGSGFRTVRAVGFEKRAEANWALDWHVDRVIAVAEKHDVPGFGKWTRKAGVWHCVAPDDVLREMLFLRLHLDDCDASNGAMEVRLDGAAETLVADRGDICVLPMLTMHRSGASKRATPRRCVRLDLANAALPTPLEWASARA